MFFIYHPPCPCGRNAPQRDAATIVLDCKDGVNEVSDSVAASLHRHHWEKPKWCCLILMVNITESGLTHAS